MVADSGIFRLPVRVYYEDTDAGGVVYYANYLKFMERARTEWLRTRGLSLVELAVHEAVLFAVHRADIDFRAPARLDDEVVASVQVTAVRRTGLTFDQEISRTQVVLCRAEIKMACVGATDFRPRPIPESVLRRLNPGSVP